MPPTLSGTLASGATSTETTVTKRRTASHLKIKVNELLRKGHLREFLTEKAKSHLSKETTGKPTEAAPVSPPRQDRVIHVISGGSEFSGISYAAAKKSTWNAKHFLEAAKPKRLLLGSDEISFTAKEQEKVLTPHHDALKSILVDNGSSGNVIFQAAYKDLGLEEGPLTWRITPLIGFSKEVKQTAGETRSLPSKKGETWMTPLVRYLEADILPEDRNEARKIKKRAVRPVSEPDEYPLARSSMASYPGGTPIRRGLCRRRKVKPG
ncbi:hypothetical protein F2Q69_00028865 [Brassica cretica]|uniref:Uncharacterized protein n=1 Tax=Brassica cretica TaxID=69181 RepID=A0A8S9S455_BRACR|nr:hypothetical protein F2Q69_00028865 [Brassica cretica]